MRTIRFSAKVSPGPGAVPGSPGVYLFRDGDGKILYVGKAKDLSKRVRSYFLPAHALSAKTALMMNKAKTFEYILTDTEKEALILEATLIKEHRPKYNICLRDDKAYPFLCIHTGHAFPRISIQRKRSGKGLYMGPYPSAGAVRETLRFVSAAFGLRTCTDTAMKRRGRPCLRFQINLCSGPCVGAISRQEYQRRVTEAEMFLRGRTGSLLRSLKVSMKKAADHLEFEKAAMLRDRIRAVENVLERQKVSSGVSGLWEVVAMAAEGDRAAVSVLGIRDGAVISQEVHVLDVPGEESHASVLSLFMRQHYLSAPIPELVLVSTEPDEQDLIARWLSEQAGRRVRIHRPRRGARFQLLSLGMNNAWHALRLHGDREDEWGPVEAALRDLVNWHGKGRLEHVECVDISTTQGRHPVGSLVAFRRGRPLKKAYRHYNIRGVTGIDDYAMIEEVVRRRLAGAREKGNLPDMMVMDGGAGQLNRAIGVVRELGLDEKVALASLAKESCEEGEKIYLPDRTEPLHLPRHDPVLLFMQRIRDEAHRFGITFHRKKRTRQGLQTGLVNVRGVGPARQRVLLRHFGSLARLKKASVEDLSRVKGVSSVLARAIYQHFHKEEPDGL